MNIIPIPKKCISLKGTYEGKKPLQVAQEQFDAFRTAWDTFHLSVLPVSAGEENVYFLENSDLEKEEYELNVRKQDIEIIYSTAEGAFRALSTLAQIMAQEEISCVKIQDKPDIPVRGIMIPVYEETVPKLETLYKTMDLMASVKYNMVQLYFDSVVFEYDSMGNYTAGKAIITKEEIRLLDAYCRERHIELMANQECLGHMHCWLKYDEFKPLAITTEGRAPFTVNPLLDETFDFSKRIFDDLLPNFTSNYVHIGMDEAYGLGLAETEQYCKTFGEAALLADYITKISGYLKETYGKRSMFWGDYAVKYPETMKMLPKDVIFVDWGYEPHHSFDRNILACKEAGIGVYVSPGTQTWGTFSGRTDVMVQNIYAAAEAARFHQADGFFLTNWDVTYHPVMNDLSYVIGGAFAWNAGYNDSIAESGNEDNCRYRNETLHSILRYFDEVVLKSTGDRSCAQVVYKMGNYYIFEQPDSMATWNGTQLYNTFFAPGLKNCDLSAESLEDIISYMDRQKKNLSECTLEREDSDAVKYELLVEIDTVILAAKVLLAKQTACSQETANQLKAELDELTERALTNMRRYNKASAYIESTVVNKIGRIKFFLN